MAVLFKPFNAQDDQKTQTQQPTGQGQPMGPGQTSVGPQAVGGPQSGGLISSGGGQGSAQQPSQSTKFSNIQKIIQANKPDVLTQKFTETGQKQTQQTGEDTAKLQAAFQGKVQEGTAPVLGAGVGSAITQAAQTPSTLTPDQIKQLQGAYTAQYKGPQNLSEVSTETGKTIGDVQSQIDKQKQTAQAAQTEQGRFSLLGQMFGRTGYSQGQKSLDNLLLQGTQGKQMGQTLQQQAGQSLAAKAKAEQAALQAQKEGIEKMGMEQERLKTGLSTAESGVLGEAGKQLTKEQQDIDTLKSQMAQGYADPELLKKFGLSAQTYGFDPSGLFGQIRPQTAQDVLNAEQANTLNILNQIKQTGTTAATGGYPALLAQKANELAQGEAGAKTTFDLKQQALQDKINQRNDYFTRTYDAPYQIAKWLHENRPGGMDDDYARQRGFRDYNDLVVSRGQDIMNKTREIQGYQDQINTNAQQSRAQQMITPDEYKKVQDYKNITSQLQQLQAKPISYQTQSGENPDTGDWETWQEPVYDPATQAAMAALQGYLTSTYGSAPQYLQERMG